MPQIYCQNLSMSYDKTLALRKVNFNVEKGDYLCILGENGSGKTTLMKGILGLLPIKEGSVRFGDGVRPTEIGYLPQQTMVQRDFPASVLEVVLSGCLNSRGLRPFYSLKDKRKVAEHLEQLAIGDLKKQSYKALSGGQQQRVLLARALCATEKMLILDEPAAGLDPMATTELYDIIKKLNKEKEVTIIMVSHDVDEAVQNSNKILQLGTTVEFFGSTRDYVGSKEGSKFLGNDICWLEDRKND